MARFIRYVGQGGRGLMDNQGLDRMKLTDDEELELIERLDLGLQQPPRDLPREAVFAFTPQGERQHRRLIALLKKAAVGEVRRIPLDPARYTVVWQSPDGQVALLPAKSHNPPSALVRRAVDTAAAENQDLGGAGYIENGRLVGQHVTDDPGFVLNLLRTGQSLASLSRGGLQELGPGLYFSAQPQIWSGRSISQWDFLKNLDLAQRQALATAILRELASRGPHYLTEHEHEAARRWMRQFVDGHTGVATLVADQPYNVSFSDPEFLEPLGIEPSRQPEHVEIEAEGVFLELNRFPGDAELEALRARPGVAGAFVRNSFGALGQTVVWDAGALVRFGPYRAVGIGQNPGCCMPAWNRGHGP